MLLQTFSTDTVLWFGPDELVVGYATQPVLQALTLIGSNVSFGSRIDIEVT